MTAQTSPLAPALVDWPIADLETLGHCPICQHAPRSLRYADLTDKLFGCAPGRWQVYACNACQTAYVDPRPTAASIGKAYAEYFTHNDGAGSAPTGLRGMVKAALNGFRQTHWNTKLTPANPMGGHLLGLLPPLCDLLVAHMRHLPALPPRAGAKLLDVGCGNGLYLDLARSAGWEVMGVDFDPKAVDSARARGLDVHLGGLEQVQDQLGQFDRVTCSHVIEHVHDPRHWLIGMHSMLRQGGSLWLQTPNVDAKGHRRFGASWLGLDAPRHLSLMTPHTLSQLLRDCGFAVRTLPLPALMALSFYQDSHALALGAPQIGARLSWRSFLRLGWVMDAWAQKGDLAHAEFITVEASRA